MAEPELESPKEEKKGGKLKWLIIGLVVLLIFGGGGFAAYQFYLKDKFFSKEQTAETAEEGQAAEGEAKDYGETELVSLPTFVVNLADPLGRRYLKLSLDVEVVDQKAAEALNEAEPKVRDAIILLLSSKTFADLSTMESKILLKKEIVERLNQVMEGSKVVRVYFTDMVVQ